MIDPQSVIDVLAGACVVYLALRVSHLEARLRGAPEAPPEPEPASAPEIALVQPDDVLPVRCDAHDYYQVNEQPVNGKILRVFRCRVCRAVATDEVTA